MIESLLHREVSTRLATLLLNLSDRLGEEGESGVKIGIRLTYQDLASMLASTREAVSKVMSEFQRGGATDSRSEPRNDTPHRNGLQPLLRPDRNLHPHNISALA